MTQERIKEIVAILDRAKEYDGISYALEHSVNELIAENKRLAEGYEKCIECKLECLRNVFDKVQAERDRAVELLAEERKITDYLRSPVQKWNW